MFLFMLCDGLADCIKAVLSFARECRLHVSTLYRVFFPVCLSLLSFSFFSLVLFFFFSSSIYMCVCVFVCVCLCVSVGVRACVPACVRACRSSDVLIDLSWCCVICTPVHAFSCFLFACGACLLTHPLAYTQEICRTVRADDRGPKLPRLS